MCGHFSLLLFLQLFPLPTINSIYSEIDDWRIRGTIIRTAVTVTKLIVDSSYSFTFRSFLCFVFHIVFFSVKVKLFVLSLYVCELPGRQSPK